MTSFALHQELYGDAIQLLFAGEKTIFAESQERFLEKWPASWHCSPDLTKAAHIRSLAICFFTGKQCDRETISKKKNLFNFNQATKHSMALFAFVLYIGCNCSVLSMWCLKRCPGPEVSSSPFLFHFDQRAGSQSADDCRLGSGGARGAC